MPVQIALSAAAALALLAGQPTPVQSAPTPQSSSLEAAVGATTRSAANVARDKYRHPRETLEFFGVKSSDMVLELWPGGGWYTEILAPYLASDGGLYVVPPAGRYDERIRAKIASNPIYQKVQVAPFSPGEPLAIATGGVDVVLTFRNVHSWLNEQSPIADQVFAEAFRVLRPGGTLGIVEHRLPEDAEDARQLTSGYVKVSTVRRLAEAAGFKFVGSSEINANPRDSKDYPEGVWTLPPNLNIDEKYREKYLAIGESDRMTLKFVKP